MQRDAEPIELRILQQLGVAAAVVEKHERVRIEAAQIANEIDHAARSLVHQARMHVEPA